MRDSQAVSINSQYSYAWAGEDAALRNLGKFDEAIKAFDKAIEVDPHDSMAWYNKRNV
jgi:tetratricopeptide (TPR) repeat protein